MDSGGAALPPGERPRAGRIGAWFATTPLRCTTSR
jgi:hypothetical protein